MRITFLQVTDTIQCYKRENQVCTNLREQGKEAMVRDNSRYTIDYEPEHYFRLRSCTFKTTILLRNIDFYNPTYNVLGTIQCANAIGQLPLGGPTKFIYSHRQCFCLHRLGQPGKYSLSLHKIICLGSNYSRNISFNFENKIVAHRVIRGHAFSR